MCVSGAGRRARDQGASSVFPPQFFCYRCSALFLLITKYSREIRRCTPHPTAMQGHLKVVFRALSMLVAGSSPGVCVAVRALRALTATQTPGEEPATSILREGPCTATFE